jgi:hypothetical protein
VKLVEGFLPRYVEFTLALKDLPESVATIAFTQWMTAFSLGKDTAPIIDKYVEWAKTPSWKKKPWDIPGWQRK